MSNTPVQEPSAQRLSSGSGQTIPSRPLQPMSDPSASKRVCFYKSGDYKFCGHRMVINARTFKTFDALLDALSKKVPLPFGVRTITTPRGSHLVRSLDDLHDGGSYVCSDQKRVKPLNLDEVRRRQVPWNTTRPLSAGRRRRQQGRGNDANNRLAKVAERVAVRTPKKLVVIKNKDPTVKRTIVLQRRIAPTFDALLDYLSQILQFPVLKLYSTDGRRYSRDEESRHSPCCFTCCYQYSEKCQQVLLYQNLYPPVDGLTALILCSGVVVAAGNEPFRLANYNFHKTGQMAQVMYMETVEPPTLQPRAQNNKSFSSGRGSRNFSLSSERYIVNQINKSRNGGTNGHVRQHNGPFETEVEPRHTSVGTDDTGRAETEHHPCIVPQDDDIEKSFRVNQDGSMTVEMKVRLTIKEEEMLHWTTTLSRASLRKGTVCASISESDNSSPNSSNAIAKDSSSISEDETKEENCSGGGERGEGAYGGHTSTALGKGKTGFKRTPTPGPRYVTKKASVESVKMVTESEVHENTLERYSYMERMADGESTEGYCVITHRSNSNRPIPKPRKTSSAGARNKGSHSSIRSSGVAEVLQIQNNGMEVTETVMHIYESQGCYDNYVANKEYSTDGLALHDSPMVPDSKPSTASSSNDIDFSWKPPTADSLQRQKEEMLSLSSEPISSTHKIMNELSSVAENEASTAANSQIEEKAKDKTSKNEKNKQIIKPARNHKSSTSSSDKKQNKRMSHSKNSGNASMGKKRQSSSESAKNVKEKSKGAEKKPEMSHSKKSIKDEKISRKDSALLPSTENMQMTPPKRQSRNKADAKDNGHNINTPTGRPQMKKNMSDILQPKKSLLPVKKAAAVRKPKSMTEMATPLPRESVALNESVSMPSLNLTPSEIHQNVENWLEKVRPDQMPYTDETLTDEPEPQTKVVFQIGGDSETDENKGYLTNVDQSFSQPGEAVKKSASCLSVPLCYEGPATSLAHTEQKSRGLCVSMPSVRVDPVLYENTLRTHKSAEDIGAADNESSLSNILSPKAKIKPVLRQLCSSIQCIRRVSDADTVSNLEKSNSLPDFSTQVALVFGSSCKAFLSFLSVMTLRDSLTGSVQGDEHQSRSTSEAMLMMESLQKISAIEDEGEQRASLTDLQSRSSSQFRERWRDFLIFRERLESEPLSPRVSETEFALDVVSEGGDAFEDENLRLMELMDELNMPDDLRAQISSTIQHARTFYPAEESTFVETEKNQSDSEEEVEQFVEECRDERKQSPELHSTCTTEDFPEKKQGNDDGETDFSNKMQTLCSEQAMAMSESEQAGPDVKDSEESQAEIDKTLNHNEHEAEQKEEQVLEDVEGENYDSKEINDVDCEDLRNIGNKDAKEVAVEKEQENDWGSEEESVEKVEEGTEEEMTVDGEEEEEKLGDKEVIDETEQGIADAEDQKTRHSDSAEETNEEDRGDEGEYEKMQLEDAEEEADEIVGESDQEGENIEQQEDEESDEKGEDVQVEVNNVEEEMEEVMGETNEGEEENTEEREEKEEEAGTVTENDVEEDLEEVYEGTEEEEDEQNEVEENEKGVVEVVSDGNVEEAEELAEETDEEEEEQNTTDEVGDEEDMEDEVVQALSDGDVDKAEEAAEETGDEEEEQNTTDEVGDEEEEDMVDEVVQALSDGDVDKAEEAAEETEAEKEVENIIEEIDKEEGREEINVNIDETDKEEDESEMVNGDNSDNENEEEEKRGQKEGYDVDQDATIEVENTEAGSGRLITKEAEEEEEDGKTDRDSEEEQKCDEVQESSNMLEKIENNLEEETIEERKDVEEMKTKGQILEEANREGNELIDGFKHVEKLKSKVDLEEGALTEDAESLTGNKNCENLRDTITYLHQRCNSYEEANVEHKSDSSTKYSSDVQCEDDKGNGRDTVNEFETDDGGEDHKERCSSRPHPVEISQELLDFVNSALQSSSLTFTYDSRGNIRIEPDNARVVQTKQYSIPKSSSDSLYGVNCLQTPSTSDLSDYRPETSESGGYKTQESVDVVTESGEDASDKPFPIYRRKSDITNRRKTVERPKSKLSASNSDVSRLKSGDISHESGSKASREDLSYFSAASSLKADAEAAPEGTQCLSLTSEKDFVEGVLIDQGRWLLKENHLIRKSPPVSLGMYGNLDSTSIDTGQENTSEDSPPHCLTQHNPLVAISSSELEEMAKPLTPKCTYYNMPHGSDSDPFLDDSSIKSGKKDTSSFKGRGSKVSPIVDNSKTRANKNGSLSSFASVEFKIPDKKVHPEGELQTVTQTRRTSSGGGSVLQAQDSLETLHLRCSQYCPIL